MKPQQKRHDEFQIQAFSDLEEYALSSPHSLRKVVVSKKAKERVGDLFAANGIDTPLTVDSALTTGFSALVSVPTHQLDDLLASGDLDSDGIIVALDRVTDPRNLGAIVRCCAFFGVKYIIGGERRQVGVTQVAVDTASGGFSRTQFVACKNLNRALETLKESSYWIMGSAATGENVFQSSSEFERSVLVLGAEGRGISPTVLQKCDRLVGVPSPSNFDSLNVSVAAGVLLAGLTAKKIG